MITRLWGRLKFALERFVLRGPLNRLVVIAFVIALIALLAAVLVHAFGYRPGRNESFWETIWWAFLRLTDPGYLGDDQGTFVRVVGTVLIVLGYVLFLGSLVAIMTQFLNATLARLQAGFTPLALNNHILILGWSSRTLTVVREILVSDARVERFLQRSGTGKLRVVILAEEVSQAMVDELNDRLGPLWDPRQIILRTGTALRLEHLRRADFLRAAAIILPAPESTVDTVEYPDARTIKTILAIGKASRSDGAANPPLMVAELSDAGKLDIALSAYGGPIEAIASDVIVGRLIAQNVRHPGVSQVYADLLRHDTGNEIYIRAFPELTGRTLNQIIALFPRAIPLGIVKGKDTSCNVSLNPGAEEIIGEGDKLVVLASDYNEARPNMAIDVTAYELPIARPVTPLVMLPHRKVLVLGWNHVVPAFVRELDSCDAETFEVDIVSRVASSEREMELARLDRAPRRTQVRMIEGEYTSLADLGSLDPTSYQNVVILSSDRLESEGETDARTILGSLVLREFSRGDGPRPDVLVELLDGENVPLVAERGEDTLLSPAAMSHILTQVALNRELRVVYDELFGPEGTQIFFRPAAHYKLAGATTTFGAVQAIAAAYGEIALGFRIHASQRGIRPAVKLNVQRDLEIRLGASDEIVVLSKE